MAEDLSIYQACSANFTSTDDLDGLLQCISDQHAQVSGVRLIETEYRSMGFANNIFFLPFQIVDEEFTSLRDGVDTVSKRMNFLKCFLRQVNRRILTSYWPPS
jgi:hypothetical protein